MDNHPDERVLHEQVGKVRISIRVWYEMDVLGYRVEAAMRAAHIELKPNEATIPINGTDKKYAAGSSFPDYDSSDVLHTGKITHRRSEALQFAEMLRQAVHVYQTVNEGKIFTGVEPYFIDLNGEHKHD